MSGPRLDAEGKAIGRRIDCDCGAIIVVDDELRRVHHPFPPCSKFVEWSEESKMKRIDAPKVIR